MDVDEGGDADLDHEADEDDSDDSDDADADDSDDDSDELDNDSVELMFPPPLCKG